MNINGKNFEIEHCLHSIAMEYAKRDLDLAISQGRVSEDETTGCLDAMFDSYIRAFAYLSNKSEDYIKALADNS